MTTKTLHYSETDYTHKGVQYHFRFFRYVAQGETDVEVIDADGQYLFTVTSTAANAVFDVLNAIDGTPSATYEIFGKDTL